MKVLLIEPDALLGAIYKDALEKAGHTVVCSRHAQSAVFTAEEMQPNLIVLELQLPGHNGVEFLYEFRSYPEWQLVPVLLHTWVNERSLGRQNLSKLGVVEYLYKPTTNLKQLVRTVNELNPTAVV